MPDCILELRHDTALLSPASEDIALRAAGIYRRMELKHEDSRIL
jgi:hypothetical protein